MRAALAWVMTNYNAPMTSDPLPGPALGGGAPVFSAFSILAVIMAVLAIFNVVGAGLGFFLAIGAIIFGVLGMLVALLPSRRGGIVSFFAIGAGVLAVLIAIIRLVGHAANV